MKGILEPLRLAPFRALFVSRTVSELGTWLAYIGLTVAVYDRTRSASWVAALLLLDLLPATLLGFVIAPLLDRFERKLLLIGAELVGAILFLALVVVHGLVPLLLVAGLAGVATSILVPSLAAALPDVVGDAELPQANALLRGVGSAAILVGPPIAGVLVGLGGSDTVFGVNGVSYLLSAAVLTRLPRTRIEGVRAEAATGTSTGGHWRQAREGLRLFGPSRPRAVLLSWTLACLGLSALNVGEVFIAKAVFRAGDTGFGILAAGSGAGLLVGSLLVGAVGDRVPSFRLYRSGIVLQGLATVAAALSPAFALAVACFAVGTVGNAVALTSMYVVLQRELPAESRGQGLGVFGSVTMTASVLGFVAAGPALDLWGARAVWAAAGLLLIVSASVALVVSRRSAPPVSRVARAQEASG